MTISSIVWISFVDKLLKRTVHLFYILYYIFNLVGCMKILTANLSFKCERYEAVGEVSLTVLSILAKKLLNSSVKII